MVDAEGRDIPWVDRDGRQLTSVAERYRPAPGQKFFMKGGGEPDFPFYEFEGPETVPFDELVKRGYKLPFFADLTTMPDVERRVIWGMMIGHEGKTRTPVMDAYTKAGFDPTRDLLQSYGDGWRSGQFLPQERQFFGIPGGAINDWNLMTSLDGLFAAGDMLFASDCVGHAAATGHYAGRHAADYAAKSGPVILDARQVEAERARLYAPLQKKRGPTWQAVDLAITRIRWYAHRSLPTETAVRPFDHRARSGFVRASALWAASLRSSRPCAARSDSPPADRRRANTSRSA